MFKLLNNFFYHFLASIGKKTKNNKHVQLLKVQQPTRKWKFSAYYAINKGTVYEMTDQHTKCSICNPDEFWPWSGHSFSYSIQCIRHDVRSGILTDAALVSSYLINQSLEEWSLVSNILWMSMAISVTIIQK